MDPFNGYYYATSTIMGVSNELPYLYRFTNFNMTLQFKLNDTCLYVVSYIKQDMILEASTPDYVQFSTIWLTYPGQAEESESIDWKSVGAIMITVSVTLMLFLIVGTICLVSLGRLLCPVFTLKIMRRVYYCFCCKKPPLMTLKNLQA